MQRINPTLTSVCQRLSTCAYRDGPIERKSQLVTFRSPAQRRFFQWHFFGGATSYAPFRIVIHDRFSSVHNVDFQAMRLLFWQTGNKLMWQNVTKCLQSQNNRSILSVESGYAWNSGIWRFTFFLPKNLSLMVKKWADIANDLWVSQFWLFDHSGEKPPKDGLLPTLDRAALLKHYPISK